MKDLKLDRQGPWEGPGRDPRGDQWEDDGEENDDDDDEDEDVDPGPCSLLTLFPSTTYASAGPNDAHLLDMLKARRVGDEGIKWQKPN